MNTVVTSKEQILNTSRELLQTEGCKSINIRAVATACGVSVGSIYNYFDSKEELVRETVESIWFEIFHLFEQDESYGDIITCVKELYQRMEEGCEKYPGFFMLHSMSFARKEKESGKQRMQEAWMHIIRCLCSVMEHDPNIRKDAFNESFSCKNFADVIFSLMLASMLRQNYDPSNLLEVIRRTVY